MLQRFLATQKDNAVLWLPVLTGLGIALYFSLQNEPLWWIGLAVLGVCAAASAFFTFIQPRQIAALFCTGLCLIALGWCCVQLRAVWVAAPVLEKPLKYAQIEGQIATIDTLEDGKGVRIVLRDPVIEELSAERTPRLVRLSVRKPEGLKAGQRIRVLAALNPPAAPVAPGGYDFQRHAYFKGIGAYGFAYKAPEILAQTGQGRLERFRQNKAQQVEHAIPDKAQSSIVSALLLGERAAIPEQSWEDIRAAGLAHVISISGLHISMIAIGVFFVTRLLMAMIPWLALHHPIKKYAAFLGLFTCIAYGIMVGMEVPTLRSVIMTGLVFTAVILDRDPFSIRLVALAAFCILLLQPESLTNPGFQMSFAAVAALIFFYEETRGFWLKLRGGTAPKWLRWTAIWLAGACATSVIATLATTPFTIYHFQQFPVYSVIGNVLALPVIGLIVMPAALAAYILMPFGAEAPAIWVMGQGVAAMLEISREIASWPYAALDILTWPPAALYCLVGAGVWVLIFKGWRVRAVAGLPLLAGCVLIATYNPPDILVTANAKLMMIRADNKTAWLSTRRSEKFSAENWLRAAGINKSNVQVWPKEGTLDAAPTGKNAAQQSDASPVAGLSCDFHGCHARLKGRVIAFAFDPYRTFAEDCAIADLVMVARPKPRGIPCINTASGENVPVIDRRDLKYNGAHSVYIGASAIRIESVNSRRGQRPWTVAGAAR